jgi:hypothetical protein
MELHTSEEEEQTWLRHKTINHIKTECETGGGGNRNAGKHFRLELESTGSLEQRFSNLFAGVLLNGI